MLRRLCAVLVAFSGLAFPTSASFAQAQSDRSVPPIYRAYTDGATGMLIVGWEAGVSSAYDLERGGLYKVWRGGQQVNDSLITPAHGDTNGIVYVDGSASAYTWRIHRDGQVEHVEAAVTRYAFLDDALRLSYAIDLGAASTVLIHETASFTHGAANTPRLERTFAAENMPADVVLDMPLLAYALASPEALSTDGTWLPRMQMRFAEDSGLVYGIQGHVRLNANASTTVSLSLQSPEQAMPPLQITQSAPVDVASSNTTFDANALPEGSQFERLSMESLEFPITAVATGATDPLHVATADPFGTVWQVLENAVQPIAEGLLRPTALISVGGVLHALEADRLTRLVDADSDGKFDTFVSVSRAWDPACAEATDIAHDGAQFYVVLQATCLNEMSRVLAIGADGTATTLADGLAAPTAVEAHDGIVWITDQQEGSVVMHLVHTRSSDKTVLSLPPNTTTLGKPALIADGTFDGQWLVGDLAGNLYRVVLEEAGEQWQGAIFNLSKDAVADAQHMLEAGGQFYIASERQLGRLQLPTTSYFDLASATLKSNGIEIVFTEPIAHGYGWDTAAYRVTQRSLAGTSDEPNEVVVSSANVAVDRQRVFLELDGVSANSVLHVTLDGPWPSERGAPIWSREAWYSVNTLPQNNPGLLRPEPVVALPNTLGPSERAEGWRLLFDGESLSGWRGYKRRRAPRSWRAEAGELIRTDHDDQVDLITQLTYTNFELAFEWKMPEGGAGAVLYGVSEERDRAAETGIGYRLHAEDKVLTPLSAGAANDVLAPLYDVVRAPGTYNESRIRVEGDTVEHWLNGFKVLTYDRSSPASQTALQSSPLVGAGQVRAGHLVIQDPGTPVTFRNIKIRPLLN